MDVFFDRSNLTARIFGTSGSSETYHTGALSTWMGTKNIQESFHHLIKEILFFPLWIANIHGLVVRITASHPAGPGSNPSWVLFVFLALFPNFQGL